MPRFKATATRTVHQVVEIEFDAEDIKDAKGKAEEKAHDVDFRGTEKESDIQVEDIRPA